MDQASSVSQPSCCMLQAHISEDILKPVLYGIEEEGLPICH